MTAEDDWRRYEQRWPFKDGRQILTYCSLSCICRCCLGNDYALRTLSIFHIEIGEK